VFSEVSPKENEEQDLALIWPNTDPDSTDIRCGRNATLGWSHPKIATVKAGDKLGFIVNEASLGPGRMYHPGFASAWLSKAPGDDLSSYLGDGDWFKIMSVTGRTEQSANFSDPAIPHDPAKDMWGAYSSQSVSLKMIASQRSQRIYCQADPHRPNSGNSPSLTLLRQGNTLFVLSTYFQIHTMHSFT
jgi:hypothetical protein